VLIKITLLHLGEERMTIEERKRKAGNEIKEKIVKAAEQLFFKGGYEELSMRKIARLIDYSPTTIYRFFKNKEDLLGTITDNTYFNLSKRFEKIKKNQSLSTLEKLKLLIEEYIRFGLANPDIYKLYIALAKVEIKDNGIYETIGGKTYRIFGSWQTLIDEMIKKGELVGSNSISIIVLIWNTVEGFIINKANNPNLQWMSDSKEINRIINMIFQGILVKINQ
jgi:AcrR family transcriptional regulator